MMTLQNLSRRDTSSVLPQKIRLDTGLIGKLTCNLHCNANVPTLHLIPAKNFLLRGGLAVDDNELISLLDIDIDRKLVLIEDISLYFALQQTKIPDSNIAVDILTEMPRSRKWTFKEIALCMRELQDIEVMFISIRLIQI